MSFLSKIFGDSNAKEIAKLQLIVDQINSLEPDFEKMTADELKNKTLEFKERRRLGATLDDILTEAFAACREASKRTIGLRHFDVQLIGGVVLHRGQIAEMKTGEGKTLVATLPLYLNALTAEGCHAVTVNDYLARRDCGWMGPIFSALGITVAVIIHETAFVFDPEFIGQETDPRLVHLRPITRQEAYAADITYGTNNEFGFDYLRDNMATSLEQMVQRTQNYAIVDEIDSILIDEARTPLIISAPAEESAKMYQQFAKIVPRLQENVDYNIDEKMRAVALTDDGIKHIEKILGLGNIYTEGGIQLVHHLEQALRANTLFKRDRDYIVKNGEVIIIDEFTGRLMHGRRYSEGLHQAIEAKENVEVKKESLTLATVTLQNYFRLYKKLSGMTGTAITEAEEFHKIYKLEVVGIPTNEPMVRKDLSDKIFATELGKFKAVVQQVKELNQSGQPALIGTISIERNELLSRLLENAGIAHQVLNAKNHEKEAQIIAQAGRLGAVTLATNMAGRGVDIILGGDPRSFGSDETAIANWRAEHNKVVELGGLFILGTERHEARRIDNQLRGRSGRQGDPGVSQFFISLEDDLMRIFGSDRIKSLMKTFGLPEDTPLENRMVSRAIESAQHRVEGYNFDIRKHLVEYDDVLNKQREMIYKRRCEVLSAFKNEPTKLRAMIWEMISDELNQIVSFHTASEDQTQWNLKEIAEVANTIFNVDAKKLESDLHTAEKLAGDKQMDATARTEVINYLEKLAKEQYDLLVQSIANDEQTWLIEKELMARAIDNLWVEHLSAIDMLRTGIGLRGYGQRDPLIEYKREAYDMFVQLLNLINKQIVYSIFKIGPGVSIAKSVIENSQAQEFGAGASGQFAEGQVQPAFATATAGKPTAVAKRLRTVSGDKVGRNDPCPCGSGRKYKKCHGA
ncbi:preprotein translocase subunit SecA [Candidatus Falkowbacteria bacterium]|nr:preprotein translocase subunit SecA [Candidatus Falkowbacteria bacterium]